MSFLKFLPYRFRLKVVTALLISSFFSLTLSVFAPSNLYFTNKSEFLLFFKDVIFYVLPPTFFLIIFFTVFLSSLKLSIHKKMVSLLLTLSLLLWLQGNIFVWRYGILDGSAIQWDEHWIYGVIDSPIWLFAVILAFVKSSFFFRFARTVAKAFILIQLLSLSITAIKVHDAPFDFFKHYYVDKTPTFNFSKNKNVILLVIDEFQSNIFQEIITQDDSYKDIFDGFVYFRDAVAGFSFTEFAIPAILTGKLYDNSVSRDVFLKEAFLNNSIPKVLKEKDFEVHIFPWRILANKSIYFDERIAANFKRRSIPVNIKIEEISRLFDVALFRCLPHFVKKYVYNDHRWLFFRLAKKSIRELKNKGFVQKYFKTLKDNELASREFLDRELILLGRGEMNAHFQLKNNTFKFYHLAGLHVPLMMNERFERHHMEYNKTNYTEQAKAYLKICEMFFNILKQNNAYDNSLIFVIGDHGSGRSEDMYINPVFDSHNDALNRNATHKSFQRDKARGIPLVLVKQFNSRGKIRTSDAPVSLIDIPATVMSELKIKGDFSGISMFDISSDSNRERYFGAFEWHEMKTDFVTPITLYVVTGFSWSNESWDVLTILPPQSSRKKNQN